VAHPDRPAPKVIARRGGQLQVQIRDDFADYPSLRASCEDFAWLVSHGAPYARAWSTFLADGNITELISGIAGVYATDPRSAELAVSIFQQSNVRAAIAAARNQFTHQQESL
jgi:flagellum-specific peptidoglycan hydrolase FlgJ